MARARRRTARPCRQVVVDQRDVHAGARRECACRGVLDLDSATTGLGRVSRWLRVWSPRVCPARVLLQGCRGCGGPVIEGVGHGPNSRPRVAPCRSVPSAPAGRTYVDNARQVGTPRRKVPGASDRHRRAGPREGGPEPCRIEVVASAANACRTGPTPWKAPPIAFITRTTRMRRPWAVAARPTAIDDRSRNRDRRCSRRPGHAPFRGGRAPASSPAPGRFGVLWGASTAMQDVYRRIGKVAPTNATVLIIRRERHRQGARRAHDPRAQRAGAGALRRGQLRRDSRRT